MTLSDEDRAEIERIRSEHPRRWPEEGDDGEACFEAGLRAGMERAAKVCDENGKRAEDDFPGWCEGCAADIREAAK